MYTSTQTIQVYLEEIGTYPRLNHEQEFELCMRVARGRTARRTLRHVQPGDTKRRAALKNEIRRGKQAQQQLVECNLRLVVYLARRYGGYSLPLEDLIQEGNLGLIIAIGRYDPNKNVRLSTYAQWWIKKAFYMAAANLGQPIPLPDSAHQERLRLRRASSRLELSLARPPTQAELAVELGLSPTRVANLQRWDRKYVSLDAPLEAHTEQSLSDRLADRSHPPVDETIVYRELQTHLHQVMAAHLSPKERTYLHVRFGLDGGPVRTLAQAAHHLGLLPKHAAQIEKRAFRQLRRDQALHELIA